jgi:hypothetical protein
MPKSGPPRFLHLKKANYLQAPPTLVRATAAVKRACVDGGPCHSVQQQFNEGGWDLPMKTICGGCIGMKLNPSKSLNKIQRAKNYTYGQVMSGIILDKIAWQVWVGFAIVKKH